MKQFLFVAILVIGLFVSFVVVRRGLLPIELSRATLTLVGGGATFPAPLVQAWAQGYESLTHGRVRLEYAVIGSGAGIRGFMDQRFMFGVSEAPLSEGVGFNIPLTLGDVALTYNLPSLDPSGEGLIFSSELTANLFLGKISRWNDPAIASLNPGVELPDLPIVLIYRSDGSGTTSIFTSFLSRVSPEWASRVGKGTRVRWPLGRSGEGNDGVASLVAAIPGALGYNSLAFAQLYSLSYAQIINQRGVIITPSLEGTTASAQVAIPRDGRVDLTNTPAPDGYPITGFSWALVYENLARNNSIPNRETAIELVRFLYYLVTEGQKLNSQLGFAPLPAEAQEVAIHMIRSLVWDNEALGDRVIGDIRAKGF
ncbi:MAG: phosphate ABC transporter substrate-binding protein PstS [Spirochaetales bacterium]|nr:phosphate ABC transporter substrate-binding protein PstS [Spirochaetales bacterium]